MPGNARMATMPNSICSMTCVYQIGNFDTRSVVNQLLTMKSSAGSNRPKTANQNRQNTTDQTASGRAKRMTCKARTDLSRPPKQSCAKAMPETRNRRFRPPWTGAAKA